LATSRRFGTLRAAYALIGYTPEVDCSYLEARAERVRLIKGLADEIVATVRRIKPSLIAERAGAVWRLKMVHLYRSASRDAGSMLREIAPHGRCGVAQNPAPDLLS
jgi:hypothetical protein